MKELFAQPQMRDEFEVTFADAVSSRDLNNRYKFLSICNEAGLIPKAEWDALSLAQEEAMSSKNGSNNNHDTFFVLLCDFYPGPFLILSPKFK